MPLTGSFTSIPSGTLVPTLSGNELSAPFDMKAKFENGSCADGEYRQYVKGFFAKNGSPVPHVLCGSVMLSPDEFRIDGCGPDAGCTAYGYRACPAGPLDQYLPDQDTGCTYKASDQPGISGNPGEKIAMDLTFRGQLINTSTSEVLATADWKVKGSATIPQPDLTTYRFSSIVTGGRPQVRIARSGDDWVVSLLYAGPPKGEAATVDIAILDEHGKELAIRSFDSTEVGGSKSTTRVLSLAVDAGRGHPAGVRVKSGDETLELPVVE